MFNRIYLYLY